MKLKHKEVENLAKSFGCSIEIAPCEGYIGLIDRRMQYLFVSHRGKQYFIGLTNTEGYLRIWDPETGNAIYSNWNKIFQYVSGAERIVQQSLWEEAAV